MDGISACMHVAGQGQQIRGTGLCARRCRDERSAVAPCSCCCCCCAADALSLSLCAASCCQCQCTSKGAARGTDNHTKKAALPYERGEREREWDRDAVRQGGRICLWPHRCFWPHHFEQAQVHWWTPRNILPAWIATPAKGWIANSCDTCMKY